MKLLILTFMDKIYKSTGRRKCAIAKVDLSSGNGQVIINSRDANEYFNFNNILINQINLPLLSVGLLNKMDIVVKAQGGGLSSQAGAVQLGIAKALCLLNSEHRGVLKQNGFLTRDARIKERRKYGLKKARKAPQYSKR
uniref:Ribosomal protein S9 n=1 Tax=Olisthodiscus luteus TaxID=83000 RepID=A0A7U0QGN3_OLILU|nr:ribosomal protein S9 [Olisthodiscus luteus]QQW50573.1 ribosomal protein S9 [Olisthodiscus luteus]